MACVHICIVYTLLHSQKMNVFVFVHVSMYESICVFLMEILKVIIEKEESLKESVFDLSCNRNTNYSRLGISKCLRRLELDYLRRPTSKMCFQLT